MADEVQKRLDLLQWAVTKQETLRSNNIARANLLVTGSTVVVAAYTLVLSRVDLSRWVGRDFQLSWFMFDVPILIGFALTAAALYWALTSCIHVTERSRRMAGEKFPGRAPFHARETVEEFANFQRFESFLREAQASELLTRLAADLWTIENLHAIKYESLRKSAACLLVAVALLLYLFLLSALGRLRGW